MGLRHRMLKLPLVLALLVVGQNHAKLSNASKKKLMQYRTMLEAAEKAGLEGNATTTTPGSTTTTSGGMNPAAEGMNGSTTTPSGPAAKVDDNATTAANGTAGALRYFDNNAGESTKADQKQLAQLIKSIFGQLSSGNPVKMVVDIKNPEVMIGNDEQEAQLGPRNMV